MHPTIRIVGFLVLTGFLSLGSINILFTGALALGLIYVLLPSIKWSAVWHMLFRLRWLFISLLLIYLLFTPGEPVISGAGQWVPTYEGLAQGGYRIASLVVIIVAVSFLLQSTSNSQLIASVRWLLTPLTIVGLSTDRLSARMVLTMEKITDTQSIMQLSRNAAAASPRSLSYIGNVTADMFEQVLSRAQQDTGEVLALPDDINPPLLQWCYPIAFGILLWFVS